MVGGILSVCDGIGFLIATLYGTREIPFVSPHAASQQAATTNETPE